MVTDSLSPNLAAGTARPFERATERLRLIPFRTQDSERLHDFFTHALVRRYLWDDERISAKQVADIVAGSQRSFAEVGYGFYGLYLHSNTPPSNPGIAPGLASGSAGEFLSFCGFCGFRRFEATEDVELLYGALPEYWGKGLVTEAARSALAHAFDECKLPRIIAATDTPNQASVRVMQRLGMTFDQRRDVHGLDTLFYSLARPVPSE